MKILHTSITVKNMNESIAFYRDKLGFDLLSRREIPENKAEIAFVGSKESNHTIELTFWREKSDYASGDELDHIALGVQNLDEILPRLRSEGVSVAKEPYRVSGSTRRIAFIKDPNGIWIELIES
ncbi:MAG: VOC family protein [Candidatus Bathyarchaeia archaeon]